MDKNDVMYLAAALVLVLIIALVIKPIVTGQPVNTGIATPTTQPITDNSTMSPSEYIQSHMTITTVQITPSTSLPTWVPGATQTVVFVDPSLYGISTNQSGPTGTRLNTTDINTSMTVFATIASGTGKSGTTGIMYMPFPYWELEYTVDPATAPSPQKYEITPTIGSQIARSGISGSYSTVSPEFSIQVMDGDDPNRIVRTITPPGGINLDLWMGVKSADDPERYPTRVSKYAEIAPTVTSTPVDPRPWSEKFYEGQRNYYFIITAQSLDSYKVEIKIPTRYVGKY